MIQRLFRRRLGDLRSGPGPERTARRRQSDHFDGGEIGVAHGLKNGVVLAIDGEQPRPAIGCLAHESGTGADEAFLIGEGDGSASGERGEGRRDAGRPGDCAHDNVRRAQRRFDHGLRSSRCLD